MFLNYIISIFDFIINFRCNAYSAKSIFIIEHLTKRTLCHISASSRRVLRRNCKLTLMSLQRSDSASTTKIFPLFDFFMNY